MFFTQIHAEWPRVVQSCLCFAIASVSAEESVISTVYRKKSLEKAISGFLFVLAVGIGLASVKVNRLENLRAPEPKTSTSLGRDDVLSPADALQWRQEFVWHSRTPKICANAWIDDKPCLRVAKQF